MSELPKRELALLGAACAVCCTPLVIGAIVAAPGMAVRSVRRRDSTSPERQA